MATNDKFDKFTERARKVLTLAQEEAQRFNHNYIGTEHLLLGLVREGDGVAARVLGNMGVQLPKVRSAVEFDPTAKPEPRSIRRRRSPSSSSWRCCTAPQRSQTRWWWACSRAGSK